MEEKELTGIIETKFKGLETQLQTAEQKHTTAISEYKSAVEALQNEFNEMKEKGVSSENFEKMQQHLDTLDIKLQGSNGRADEKKSFGEVLTEGIKEKDDDYQKFLRKETQRFSIELKAAADMSTANVTGTRYGQIMAPGIIESPKRKVHMSDILPGGSIGPGNSFTFMREKGTGEGAPAPVAEGDLKAQFDLDLEEADVKVETVAGWVRVTRKAMNNIPGFVSFLQSRLPEKFQRSLDNQILYGNGTTPNLKGILTAGNFVASTSTGTNPLVEKIIDDIATLDDTYERDATGILLRTKDYYSFFKNKASGSGEYDLPPGVTIGNDGVLRILGIPVWNTTALNVSDYVVGDFDMGAQLLTQNAMRIEFFEQDGINVRENKITVRIEGDYALPVYGPNYFIKGSSSTGV